MRTPRVSVVIPSYNHAEFVGQAIESVLAQSFDDFELIITDDGSTDGSAEIIRGYTDPRIDFEAFGANRGASETVNRCIARAAGEYVALLGSDDYFLPGKHVRQVAILDAAPALAGVFGLVEFVDDDGAAIPAHLNPIAGAFSAAPANRFAWLRRFFLEGNALCHSTAMIRKSIYDELGGYDVALRQLPDMEMWIRICARYPIEVVPEPLTAFRVLRGQRNTSAETPFVIRRSNWEYRRVLRHYRTMDEATLERAFGADIPQCAADRGLPMAVQLALLAAAPGMHRARQLYALETLEDAIARGLPGLTSKELHERTGELDPFRIIELREALAACQRLEQRAANAETQRDDAVAQIAELQRRLQRKRSIARETAARHAHVDLEVVRLREERAVLAQALGSREAQIAELQAALTAKPTPEVVSRPTGPVWARTSAIFASLLATTFWGGRSALWKLLDRIGKSVRRLATRRL